MKDSESLGAFMKLFILIFLNSMSTFAVSFEAKDFKWMENLKQHEISEVNICGNANILNTFKSLKKNFFVGNSLKGYVFSQLPSHAVYWEILRTKNKDSAKDELKKAFFQTILWEVSADGRLTSLGQPSSFDPKFTATVKDCVEGVQKTIGSSCTDLKVEHRVQCCSEKFIGPQIRWKNASREFTLMYSPDPSVRLRVPGEKSHRYCHVVESIKF